MDTLRIGGTPTVAGFDFAFQGLFGVWEAFPPSRQEGTVPATSTPQTNDSPNPTALFVTTSPGAGNSRPPSSGYSRRLSVSSHSKEPSANTLSSAATLLSSQPLDFDAAVDMLNEKRSKAEHALTRVGYSTLEVKTNRPGRRKLALALCDGDLSKDDFIKVLKE